MPGGTRGTAIKLGAAATLLALAMSGCSKDSSADQPKRRCAVVQADQLTKLVDAKVTLLDKEKGSAVCRFVADDGSAEIRTSVDGPVEKGLPELLLADPTKVAKVGDEAWIATKDTPLGTRMLVRKGGALLTLDLRAPKLSGRERTALATDIAAKAVSNLPKLKVKPPTGARGAAACKRYTARPVAVALGGVPVVKPSNPPGSCLLTVDDNDLTASVGVLMETGAGKPQLDGIVSATKTAVPTKVGTNAGYWLESPAGPDTGGQLDFLSHGRLLQVAIIGQGLGEGQALAMATTLAKTADAT